MSKNYAIIIQFVLPLTKFYRSGAQRNNVYKRDAFVTSWRSHNRAWQPRRHDRLSETSGTLWIHRGALTNQRCSLATGCGIICLMALIGNMICSQNISVWDEVEKVFPWIIRTHLMISFVLLVEKFRNSTQIIFCSASVKLLAKTFVFTQQHPARN